MKKVLLFVAVVSAFSFVSCKKDHTCTCTTVSTPTGGGTATTYVDPVTINDAKKGDAKKACISRTETDSNSTDVTTCELK